MQLHFEREQTVNSRGRVVFRLFSLLEPDSAEKALIERYRMADAILIGADDRHLLKGAVIRGGLAFLLLAAIFTWLAGSSLGLVLGLLGGIGVGYFHFNEKRETIYVKDLLHGRHFKCDSVIDLAEKEAWLANVSGYFRQVLEGAKHWDGRETHLIEPLPPQEAKALLARG